jgi:hypothetical protein
LVNVSWLVFLDVVAMPTTAIGHVDYEFGGRYCKIAARPHGFPPFAPFAASACWTPARGRGDIDTAAPLLVSEIEQQRVDALAA